MKAPQPIPYQGSKRQIAPLILSYFPQGVNRLIEPFAGSAAVSIAASMKNKAKYFIINDINSAIIDLLDKIVNNPQDISLKYEKLWLEQSGKEREFYDDIREEFNKTKKPEYFLFVMARCVKGAIRYNSNGKFNQSPDNRRKGKKPINMTKEIFQCSELLKNRVSFYCTDFSNVLELARENDLIYMDPPYQGTCNARDSRYYSGIRFEHFVESLDSLNNRNVPYIISYDGRTGNKRYGVDIPDELHLHKVDVEVGRSTQATFLGNNDITYETLYLSKALAAKLQTDLQREVSLYNNQMSLFNHTYA
jgi:DNA adenine methylase